MMQHAPRLPGPKELGDLAHLLFEWPIRQAPRLALPFFILVAAVIQAAMIFLFSINYHQPAVKHTASAQIYFIPADSAVARRLDPWLEANDPAVFSPQMAARAALPSPPPLGYRPSYEEPPPPLRPLPAERPVEIRPPIPATLPPPPHKSRVPLPASVTTGPPASTTVQWEDELQGRIPTGGGIPVQAAAAAGPSLYQVGIGAGGMPMHCVLLEGSGDAALDQAGRVWILARRFQPSENDVWGRVRILWGSPSANKPPGTTSTP
jgi:hypothetical protein